jgi:tetratricopeptide (TPR) repeat protein
LCVLGMIDAQEGKAEDAEKNLRAAIRMVPGFGPAHGMLGTILVEGGKLDEGISESREAIRANPELAAAHHALAMALNEKGDEEGALGEFQKAAQLEPDKYLAPVRQLAGHTRRVWAMVFSRDSRLLASGSLDETVKVWDVATGRLLDTYRLHGSAFPIDFSPDGKSVATGSSDLMSNQHSFKLWDVGDGQELHCRPNLRDVRPIAFSSDWHYMAADKGEGHIGLYDFEKGVLLRAFSPGILLS